MAKWIFDDYNRVWTCSNCGSEVLYEQVISKWCGAEYHEKLSQFCPNCGEEMYD